MNFKINLKLAGFTIATANISRYVREGKVQCLQPSCLRIPNALFPYIPGHRHADLRVSQCRKANPNITYTLSFLVWKAGNTSSCFSFLSRILCISFLVRSSLLEDSCAWRQSQKWGTLLIATREHAYTQTDLVFLVFWYNFWAFLFGLLVGNQIRQIRRLQPGLCQQRRSQTGSQSRGLSKTGKIRHPGRNFFLVVGKELHWQPILRLPARCPCQTSLVDSRTANL